MGAWTVSFVKLRKEDTCSYREVSILAISRYGLLLIETRLNDRSLYLSDGSLGRMEGGRNSPDRVVVRRNMLRFYMISLRKARRTAC